jgi:hypothetical protein
VILEHDPIARVITKSDNRELGAEELKRQRRADPAKAVFWSTDAQG